MKSFVFWYVTTCSPLKVNRRLGEHVTSVFSIKKYAKRGTSVKTLLATCFHIGFLLGLFFDPEDGVDMINRNMSILSTEDITLQSQLFSLCKAPLTVRHVLLERSRPGVPSTQKAAEKTSSGMTAPM
jgi:hypothetical protein